MTSVERVSIPQKAMMWAQSGTDNYGEPQVTSPQEIDVEWPQGFSESNGVQDSKESSSDTLIVNENIALGSILWFGAEIDLPSGTADPSPLYVVTSRRVEPDIKGRNFRYTLTVSRYSNTLPTLV
jgi:hypothetical protein